MTVTSIICIALDFMSNQTALLIAPSLMTDQISAQSVRQLSLELLIFIVALD